jgi:hypothetical protein
MSVRTTPSILAALATLLVLGPALAADANRKACVEATEKGQTLRDDNKFSDARAQFLICSDTKCPAVIAKQCTEWLQKLEADQPSIAFRAKDAAGKDLIDVQVSVDGTPLTSTLDGKALNVEPGVHTFKYVHAGAPDIEEKVVVRIGEKNRFVDVTFANPNPTPAVVTPPPSTVASGGGFKVPLVAWISGAVGLAGFGVMTAFAVMANGDESSLRTSCAPHCAQSDVDAIQTKLTLANVMMAVGIVGVGVAATTIIVANVGGGRSQKTGGARVRVQAGVGWAGLSGSF